MIAGDGAAHIVQPPSEYLKRVWFDTVTQIPLAIRYAVEFAGAGKLMFSSDHPWVQPQPIVDAVEGAMLSEEQRQKVYSGTARNLFQLTS